MIVSNKVTLLKVLLDINKFTEGEIKPKEEAVVNSSEAGDCCPVADTSSASSKIPPVGKCPVMHP